jgi:hypothetical protein
LTVATSRQHLLAVDPSLPLRLRELLLSGTRLIVLDDPKSSRDDLVYFELVLRQSKTTYVVQASLSATVEKTAEALAGAVISADARLLYEWELVEATAKEEPLTPFHTLEMAGIKSGSKLMLLGNHKTPVWAPAFSPRRRF